MQSLYKIGFVFFLLMGISGKAQTLIFISESNNEPILFSTIKIVLIPSNDNLYFVTDSVGKINLPSNLLGQQVLLITSLPLFEFFSDTLLIEKENLIKLKAKATHLEEFVVTAQYLPTSPDQAVHKVKVIDRKKIELMGAQNLRDVLSNEMNVRISQDNTLGSSMSIQGVSGQNVKILIDGVPVVGRLNGNIDISQINMFDVERIEIIEGPLSVNYGTDALAGTINIITKKSLQKKLSVNADAYYESNGNYNSFLNLGLSKSKNIFLFSIGRNFFDGWSATDPDFSFSFKGKADSTRFQSWKPKEQYFSKFTYGLQLKNFKLMYTLDVFQEFILNRGYPRSPYAENAFDDTYKTQRLNNTISLSGFIKEKFYLNSYLSANYFRRVKNTYFKDLTNLSEQLTSNTGDQDTTVFLVFSSRTTISRIKKDVKINYELGYELNHESAVGLRIEDNKKEILDLGLFTSAEWKIAKTILIRPAVRYNYNSVYTAPIIPSINIKWSPNTKRKIVKGFTARGSYASGFRSPGVKELYFYFVDINHNIIGNTNLKAEYSNNFQVSLTKINECKKITLKLDLSAYYNSIHNLITLAQVNATEYSYVNIGNYKSNGLQFNTEIASKQLRMNLGFAYLGRANETTAMEFLYSPELRFAVNYLDPRSKINVALFYKFTGKLNGFSIDSDGNTVATYIDDYHLADVSITRDFCKEKLKVTLGSKNLFDVQAINSQLAGGTAHSSGSSGIWIGTGRTYFIKFSLKFSK